MTTTKDEDFSKTLRATFKVEAEEHVHAMATGVLELEKAPGHDAQRRLVETVFRAAHSLKGAARAVDFTDIESHCQSLEEIIRRLEATGERADARGVGCGAPHPRCRQRRLDRARPGARTSLGVGGRSSSEPGRAVSVPAEAVVTVPATAERTFSPEDTVRITVAKLNARLLEAEEMLTAKLTTGQRAAGLA